MISKKELSIILLSIVIGTIAVSAFKGVLGIIPSLIAITIIIITNVLAKKIIAHMLDANIEVKIWDTDRLTLKRNKTLKKPFPLGVFLPLISSIISLGSVFILAFFSFDAKSENYRVAKRFGLYSFTEVTEKHFAAIASIGIFANIVLGIIAYIFGYDYLAQLNVFFVASNLIPFSNLDGTKIFFGNRPLWTFLAVLALIGLGYVFLIV